MGCPNGIPHLPWHRYNRRAWHIQGHPLHFRELLFLPSFMVSPMASCAFPWHMDFPSVQVSTQSVSRRSVYCNFLIPAPAANKSLTIAMGDTNIFFRTFYNFIQFFKIKIRVWNIIYICLPVCVLRTRKIQGWVKNIFHSWLLFSYITFLGGL